MVVKYEDIGRTNVTEVTDVAHYFDLMCPDEGNGCDNSIPCLVVFIPKCSCNERIALSTSYTEAMTIIDEIYTNGRVDVTEYNTEIIDADMCGDMSEDNISNILSKLSYWSKLSKAAE